MHPEWWAARARIGQPGRPSPWVAPFVRRFLRPLVRAAHRPVLEGAENLPREGPFLLVANHSGGVSIAEILSFIALYLDHAGADRPLAALAHPAAFHVWPISFILRSLGAVPSSYAAAEPVLAAGIPILIFPGGDYEALRPIWQANTVDFGGRVGFLRIARRARVPIVPMGIRGSHCTAPILWRSDKVLAWFFLLPRLFGLKRYPITLLGALGVAAIAAFAPWAWPWRILASWAWMGSILPPLLPWIPWTVRIRIGAPIAPEELFGGDDDDELRPALGRVEAAVQALVRR